MLNGIKYEHLCRLVEYLYSGTTKVAASELDEFFLSIKKFKILGLHEPQNTNNFPRGPSVFRANRSVVHGSDDDDDVVVIDESGLNQAGHPEPHGTKRKTAENLNESASQLGETSRKSIQTMPKRTCEVSQQPLTENGTQQPPIADTPPANGSPSVEKTTKPTTRGDVVATKKVDKQVTPKLFQFPIDDVRKAMKALNTTNCDHATVILVAKEMGYDIANNKLALQSMCGKMSYVVRCDAKQSGYVDAQKFFHLLFLKKNLCIFV